MDIHGFAESSSGAQITKKFKYNKLKHTQKKTSSHFNCFIYSNCLSINKDFMVV